MLFKYIKSLEDKCTWWDNTAADAVDVWYKTIKLAQAVNRDCKDLIEMNRQLRLINEDLLAENRRLRLYAPHDFDGEVCDD